MNFQMILTALVDFLNGILDFLRALAPQAAPAAQTVAENEPGLIIDLSGLSVGPVLDAVGEAIAAVLAFLEQTFGSVVTGLIVLAVLGALVLGALMPPAPPAVPATAAPLGSPAPKTASATGGAASSRPEVSAAHEGPYSGGLPGARVLALY